MIIHLKRIYEAYSPEDKFRVLADRLWARGIKKVDANIDLWVKNIAPSNEIRKKFHSDNDYEAFQKSYTEELNENPDCPEFLNTIKKYNEITLLTAAKDVNRCHLPILEKYIKKNIQL